MKTWLPHVLAAFAGLLWGLGLGGLAIQPLALNPDFYVRLFGDWGGTDLLTQLLATELLAQIPEPVWSPWIPRDPERLEATLGELLTLVKPDVEVGRIGQSTAAWWMGLCPDLPDVIVPIAEALRGPLGEVVRGVLWRALPACAGEMSAYCVPTEPGAWAAVGLEHQAWWDAYVLEFADWAVQAEVAWQSRLDPVPWIRYLLILPLVGLGAAVVAALLVAQTQRWLMLSIPLLAGGLIAVLLGATLEQGLPGAWDVAPALGLAPSSATALIWPRLWGACAPLLGETLSWPGAASVGVGLLFLVPAIRLASVKWLSGSAAVLVVGLVILFYPTSTLWPYVSAWYVDKVGVSELLCRKHAAGVLDSPALEVLRTLAPTPWPTLTSTPTATATPVYWPVAQGTPLPTPRASLSSDLSVLGCYQPGSEAVSALSIEQAVVTTFQASRIEQRSLPQLRYLAQRPIAPLYDQIALSATNSLLVTVQGSHVRAYMWPSSLELWQGRVSVVGAILLVGTAAHDSLVVLVTDTNQMWVLRAATGGLASVVDLEAPALLLACDTVRPVCLVGQPRGALSAWQLLSGTRISLVGAGGSPLRTLAAAPNGESFVSVTEDGRVTLWQLEPLEAMSEYDATIERATTAVWRPPFLLVGTEAGELIVADIGVPEARQTGLFRHPVTSLAVSAAGYVAAGSSSGDVCLLGSLYVP